MRKTKRLALAPVFVWLFIQLSMTGVFSPASASATSENIVSDGFNTTVICTRSGYKRITLNADGSFPADVPADEYQCPWCMHFGSLPPLAAAELWPIAPLFLALALTHSFTDGNRGGQNFGTGFHIRAPPL